LKNKRSLTTTSKAFDRGEIAGEIMMSGLRDFYNNRILQYNEQIFKLYQIISHNIAKELQDFHNSAAEVAIPEPHLPG
jgi:hypothetical protein